MFDIGFPELLLISIVALLVFGPERLPEVLRTLGGWIGSAKRSFGNLRAEIEREVGADDIRRDLHNNRVMEEVRQLQQQMRGSRDEVEEMLGTGWNRDGSPSTGADADRDAAADRADDAGLEKPADDAQTPVDPAQRGDDPGDDAPRDDPGGDRPAG